MKQDNNTTASIWWHNLPYSAKYDLSIQYFKMVPGTLNDEAIEEIHNGEHPEQPIKEDATDLRVQALNWWNNELTQDNRDFHFSNYSSFTPAKNSNQLTGREIQNIWAVQINTTIPVKEQSSKRGEGDILEGKIVSDSLQQWDNVGYDKTDNPKDTYIAGAKFIGLPLAKENQALRESNIRLKEALLKIDAIAYRNYGWKVADDIADIAKEALNNK